jgi:hypothetical protein
LWWGELYKRGAMLCVGMRWGLECRVFGGAQLWVFHRLKPQHGLQVSITRGRGARGAQLQLFLLRACVAAHMYLLLLSKAGVAAQVHISSC